MEVHGMPGTSGIDATKIELKSIPDDTEIKGTVDAIDTNNSTVTLSNITVDYSTTNGGWFDARRFYRRQVH